MIVDEKNRLPLASEMYSDLKETNLYLRKVLHWTFAVIALLVIALAGTNLYHIHQWSQFDTIVVDSCKQSSKTGQIWPGSIPVPGRGIARKYTSGKS